MNRSRQSASGSNVNLIPDSLKKFCLSFKGKKLIPFFIVWFLACGTGLYFRLYPLLNYTSHEISEKATLLVLANLRKQVEATVHGKYPHLPEAEQNQIIKKQFDALLHAESDTARQTIQRVARTMGQAEPSGQKFPYLLASDSYYYFGLTENIQHSGAMGSTVKGSKYLNPLMLAPLGHWEPFTLHPFVGYYIYRIMSFFRPDIPLMYAVSFTPLVITALTLIAFLFACFFLGCSPLASFAGSLSLLMAPIFLKRSAFGWYDNDPYNTLFPFIILAILFYGLKKRENTKLLIIIGFLCSLFVSLYALFWQGWVFIESIIIASGIFLLLYNHFYVKQRPGSKNLLLFFAVAATGTLVGISVIFGIGEFFVLFQEGWAALKNFLQPQLALWPNLYISVGELYKAPLSLIVNLTGGVIFFTIAAWGLAAYLFKLLRNAQDNKENLFPFIIITVFLVFAVIVSMGAQRFILLCLVPLSLLFTLGVQNIFDLINTLIQRKFNTWHYRYLVVNLLLTGIVAGLVIIPLPAIYKKMPSLLNPIFNSAWENTLIKIKENTPPESIINTWWPPGHFIKAIAERRVTFDGATINNPQAYWLANVFLSRDEGRALGFLRMLNNSASKAAEYLVQAGFKLSEAVQILKEITPLPQEAARNKLHALMDKTRADALLNLTHKAPPPSYLLIYNELIEKNIEMSFVGNWNFKKIEELDNNPALRREIPPSGSRDHVSFLWDTVGGRPKYHDPLSIIAQSQDSLLFEHNIRITLKDMDCFINSGEFGKGIPYSLFYLKDGRVVEKKFPDASLPYSVLLVHRPKGYACVLLDTSLAKSLMMQLYFFEGKGLKYIRPFLKETDLTGRTQIYVYEIDWEGFLEDLSTGS